MAFEGAQMVPVYDMNKSDGDGFMGGGAGWMWVVMLFFLLAWGGGFGGFGGGANGAVNTLTNEFLYTNLNNTIDRGFNQLANQNFGIQKDICESTGASRSPHTLLAAPILPLMDSVATMAVAASN